MEALFSRSEKGNIFGVFLLFANFLQTCLITFYFLCTQLLVDDINKLIIDFSLKVIFKVRKVRFGPFSDKSLYSVLFTPNGQIKVTKLLTCFNSY